MIETRSPATVSSLALVCVRVNTGTVVPSCASTTSRRFSAAFGVTTLTETSPVRPITAGPLISIAGPGALPALTQIKMPPTIRTTRTTSTFHMGRDCTGSSRDSHCPDESLVARVGRVSRRVRGDVGVVANQRHEAERATLARHDGARAVAALDERVPPFRRAEREDVRVLRHGARVSATHYAERQHERWRRRALSGGRAGAQAHGPRSWQALSTGRRTGRDGLAAAHVLFRRRGCTRGSLRRGRLSGTRVCRGARCDAAQCARGRSRWSIGGARRTARRDSRAARGRRGWDHGGRSRS